MVSLRIGILGTRGVPPRYGGFETFAGELSRRLVERGHEVSVYCRSGVIPSVSEGPVWAGGAPHDDLGAARPHRSFAHAQDDTSWHGVRRIVLPAIRHKYFETVSHTFLSAFDALRRDFDVILLCNAANAFVLPLLRAARIPVAINVDGIERRRRSTPSTLMATGIRAARSSGRTNALAALQRRTTSKSRRSASSAERRAWLTVSKYLWRRAGRTMRSTPSGVRRPLSGSRQYTATSCPRATSRVDNSAANVSKPP